MNKVSDRKRLRREYLWRKGKAYFAAISFSILCLSAVWIFCIMIAGGASIVYDAAMHKIDLVSNQDMNTAALVPIMGFVMIVLTVISGKLSWLFWDKVKAAKTSVRILYVPPVTLDTIPAEEILVRGSDETPVAQSEVLLRAAQQGQQTPKEALLRVSQG